MSFASPSPRCQAYLKYESRRNKMFFYFFKPTRVFLRLQWVTKGNVASFVWEWTFRALKLLNTQLMTCWLCSVGEWPPFLGCGCDCCRFLCEVFACSPEVLIKDIQRAQYLYPYLYLLKQENYLHSNKSGNRFNNPVFVFIMLIRILKF